MNISIESKRPPLLITACMPRIIWMAPNRVPSWVQTRFGAGQRTHNIEALQVDGATMLFSKATKSGLAPSKGGWSQSEFDGWRKPLLLYNSRSLSTSKRCLCILKLFVVHVQSLWLGWFGKRAPSCVIEFVDMAANGARTRLDETLEK